MRYALCLCAASALLAQDFSHRGFLETRGFLFPQTAPGDSGRVVGDALFRYEAFYRPAPQLRLSGALDARSDTHHQVERDWGLSWQDRGRRRPSFAVRRLSAAYRRGRFTAEAGKQLLRWGKTDILTPTDRFAPRDFLNVVDSDFLAVTAARLTYESGGGALDLVWAPRFTPSRIPLLNQRWVVLPEGLPEDFSLREAAPHYPGGSQFGVRWSRLAGSVEYAFAFYDGFNHLPVFDVRLESLAPLRVEIERIYPQMRMYGGDLAVPAPWFTVKVEAAHFSSRTPQADEYVLYVVQLERTAGEWFLIGGYAGEAVTTSRNTLDFAPDRGFTRAFLGRAGYTIDPRRSLTFEGAVRQNGAGVWLKAEYAQTLGQHWRATAALTVIRGDAGDFLGQYRRNSHATLAVRYSF